MVARVWFGRDGACVGTGGAVDGRGNPVDWDTARHEGSNTRYSIYPTWKPKPKKLHKSFRKMIIVSDKSESKEISDEKSMQNAQEP